MEFDALFQGYKTRIDMFIDRCEGLCYNPTFEEYLTLKQAFYEAYDFKREMRQMSKGSEEYRQKFREVLKYKHYLIPEFEPIRIFEQVIKLRQKRQASFDEIVAQNENNAKKQKYLLTLQLYCKKLDEKEKATKLNQNFPRETKLGIPTMDKMLSSKFINIDLEHIA